MLFALVRRARGTSSTRARAVALGALWVLLAALPAAAQQAGTVTGRVLDARTGAPLTGASVTLAGDSRVALTDAEGRFRLTGVAAGAHTVLVQQLGREAQRRAVLLDPGASASVEFRLAEQVVLLPSVVISATREERRLTATAAAVGVVTGAELRAAKPAHPAAVMGQIPGVYVNVTGGEGHQTAIRQPLTTNPVYLFLEDGIPTRSTGFFNHNALYEINVPQAERIEVLKGPATALYGSDAIGGVINVETRRPSRRPGFESFAEGGAFGWNRFLGSVSGGGEGNAVRADLNVTHTDGWRQGTGYDRASGTLRWDHAFDGGATLKTVATVSRIEQQTAGSSALARDDYLHDPTRNYTPISFRNVRAGRLSAAYERQGAATSLTVTPYVRWNEMEILPNWSLSYDPTVYTTGHSSAGLLVRLRRDIDALRTRVVGGVDLDYSPGSRLEHQVAAVRSGPVFSSYTQGNVLYDYDVTFRGVSPYVQAEIAPTDRLHFTAGLRYDRLGYRYDNRLEALATGRWRRPEDTEVSYQHLSPKLGATYELGRALNLYASYNHGFRAPSEGQLFRQGQAVNTVGLKPVNADSYEGGVRGQLGGRLGYTLAVYRMEVENDVLTFINPDGTRETQNAGRTLHRGVEVGLNAALSSALRADVGYSRARHGYEEWSPNSTVDYGGNEMENAPRTLLNARLTYSPAFLADGRVALEWSRIGSYWMDADNTHRYAGHGLLNLQASAPVTHGIEVIGRVSNLTDERYAESAAFTTARGEEFAPGLPRTVYLGVQYRWQKGL